MSEIVRGTCSKCGGPVVEDTMTPAAPPECKRCHRKMKDPYGPSIEMTESEKEDRPLFG